METSSQANRPGLATRFSRHYGLVHPFAGAGMAFAGAGPELAIGVCQGGGIGAVGVGFTPPEVLRSHIRAIRAATSAPFNINFIACFDNDAQLRVCAEEQVPIVSFHWGHPSAGHLKLIHDAGLDYWAQVGNEADARRAVDDGANVIIAQGWEAGGHNYGGLPAMALVPGIVDAVGARAMVLASGGIADGRGAAAALALGADGVWVGTRLLATPEADIHPEHLRRLLAAHGSDTVRSAIFGPEWPHFNPMRLLRNEVVDSYTDRLADVPTERDELEVVGRTVFLGQETLMRKFNVILPTRETTANFEEMPMLAGQAVGLVREVLPAAEVVAQMMGEAHAIISALARIN